MTILYLALAYFAGVFLGRLAWDAGLFNCNFPSWLWLMPLALLPFTLLLRRFEPAHGRDDMAWPESAGFKPPRRGLNLTLIAAATLCLSAGTLRYASRPLTPCWTPDDLAYYNLPADQAFERAAPQVTVSGYVSVYPLVADRRQRVQITARTIETGGAPQEVAGVLLLNTGIRQRYVYGQPVVARGRLVTPPDFEDFSYREFLARKGVHSLLYGAQIEMLPGENQGQWLRRVLYAFRARGEALLNRLLPEPYAALANGMLLGIEAGIPDDLYEQFNLTGTSHVIVISGSNVALIAGVMMALGQRLFGRRRAVYPALAGIACYALLVGGDAAVLRAALMGGLFVAAISLGRRSTALVSLAFACWIMTLANPLTLWDVGFQLSSAATAGLILFTPVVTGLFSGFVPGITGGHLTAASTTGATSGAASAASGLLRGVLEDGLIVTIAANVTTLPLVLYYFGRLSVVSLLTNLLIAPVQPLIMLWGSGALLVGAAGLTLPAQVLLWIPWLSLAWTVAAVQWSAALPGASLEIAGYGLGALTLTYAALFALLGSGRLKEFWQRAKKWRADRCRSHLLQPATAGVLCVAGLLVWSATLSLPDGRLHVHFLDIGQGDGIFIQTPSGRQVLIDGGSSPQQLFSELGAVMPFWDRSIDVVALTHPDGDHMQAQVEVPVRFTVDHALDTAISQANPDAAQWRAMMAEAGVSVQIQETGGWLDLGDGVVLWVLWPPPGGLATDDVDNENSLVMRLVYGDFSVLLTGDAGLPSEAVWLEEGLPLTSTVLKVGHHGSDSSTGPDFVEAVQPTVAVIQVGAENDYGHPRQEVLDTLAGRLILRNDLHGRVHIWSDGRQMWIKNERGGAIP